MGNGYPTDFRDHMSSIFFILGLFIGSFLNVVVFRLHSGMTLMGRSKCPQCKTIIAWYDNIPLVSFFLLRQKCRHCHKKISWQYPAGELLTGAVFAVIVEGFLVAQSFANWGEIFLLLTIASFLIVIFIYDLKFMEIPMTMAWGAIIFAFLSAIFRDVVHGTDIFPHILEALLSGGGVFLFFFALTKVSKEKWMGEGDAYVGLIVGLLLGWPGAFLALLFAFTLGALFGIGILLFGIGTLKTQVPFAPFLIGGLFCALIFLKTVFFDSSFLFFFL